MNSDLHKPNAFDGGRDVELDLFYEKDDPRREKVKEACNSYDPLAKRADFRSAIMQVIRHQQGPGAYSRVESWQPTTGVLSDIHFRIANRLSPKDWSKVQVHPSLGTDADFEYHTDMIVEYTAENGNTYILTVDVTVNDEKIDEFNKPDVDEENRRRMNKQADILIDLSRGALVNPAKFSPDISKTIPVNVTTNKTDQIHDAIAETFAKALQEKKQNKEAFFTQPAKRNAPAFRPQRNRNRDLRNKR